MALAGKCLLPLLAQFVAPAIEHPFGHAQVAGDLRDRLLAALAQVHSFQLEFTSKEPLVVVLFRPRLLRLWFGMALTPSVFVEYTP
jgi:hypothetical protein